MKRSPVQMFVHGFEQSTKRFRRRRLRLEQLENRMLMVSDLSTDFSSPAALVADTNADGLDSDEHGDENEGHDYAPDSRLPSEIVDETNWVLRLDATTLENVLELSSPAVIGRFTQQTLSFSTLANGMPILNSLVGSPTSVFLDFDGDTTTSTDPYDVDGNPTTFNTAEQATIAEAWRHIATYFAMFDTDVTTVQPATAQPKVWAAIGNNIVGGYCSVNAFPNSQPRCFNNSGDARTRQSGIAHEVGHNFGLSHQSDFDLLGAETADYSSGYDELHVPIMGVDFAQRVRKFVIGHTSNASALQDDVNVVRNKIVPYQAVGGDGFRADDFGGTIATATALTSMNDVQYASGIIERLADVDAFSFSSNGQAITVSALADFPSGVDLKLEIYDALGVLVAAKDAPTLNDQEITLVLASGTYYALVSSHGNYGDLGTYNLAVRSLPAGWTAGDIGVVGVTGFSQFHSSTNSFVLGASGADISQTGTTDEMQFARQTLTGDGTIIAKIASLVNTTGNAKAGIEIRESLSGNSKHVSLTPTPTGGVKFIRRTTTGGNSTTTSTAATAFVPVWVRLQRVGNVFTASTSPDGTTWTTVGSPATVTMNATVQIGLVATAQNDRLFTAAEFENVSITGTLGSTEPPPNSLPAPTDVTVSRATGADLAISWTDQASETGYRIERSIDGATFTTAGTTLADVTTFNDTGLVGTMRYFYRVRALDASGASVPSMVVNELNRPSAVGNLELTSYTMTQIVLDWIETSGETGYRIERSPDGVTYTTIATVGANIPSYTNSSLTAGTTYFYRVTPTSDLGDGPSTVISGGTRLAQVTNLAFTSILGNAISLSWTDLTTETGYRIQRSTNGTSFSELATLAGNTTTYTDTTITAGNEYYYRVLGTSGQSVSLMNLAFTGTPTIDALPSPWIAQDIGTVSGGGGGSTTYTTGTSTFKVVSSGSNIGGTSDSFRFTHQTLVGDGVITARVASLEDSGGTSTRFGVMFRETLNNNARYAMMALREGNTGTAQFSSRTTVGLSANTASDLVRNAPYWVRVTRAGNVFTGFTSSNGTTWTQIGQATIAMSSTLYVGLAASAGSTSVLNTATATNVSVLANPVLAITSGNQVYNNSVYTATASITGNSPLPPVSFVYYSDAGGTNIISAPENVGTYYVRATSIANAGNNAAQSPISTFQITPFSLTVSAIGQNKVYDAIDTAMVTLSDNRFSGDVFTLGATATFNNKNAGTAKPIGLSNVTLTGQDASNYTIGSASSTPADITPREIDAQVDISNKVYDGTVDATIESRTLIGVLPGDSVSYIGGTAEFSNKNVGSEKIVTATGLSLDGPDAANYVIFIEDVGVANITRKPIAATSTAADKVYDATTNATVTISLVGVVIGDDLSGTAVGTFSDKNIANGKLVTTGPVTLTGADSNNYTVGTVPDTTADITPASISSITGITADNKVYDSTTGATLVTSGAIFTGIFGSDTLTVASATGNFVDKNVANGKTVNITGLSLGGTDASNYTLVSTTSSTTADITPASITAIIGITANDKVFDGNTTATLVATGAAFTGIFAGDSLTVATATGNFVDPNVGNGKTVNIAGLTLGGADAGNYSLDNNTATTTANILAGGSVVNTQLFYRAIGTNAAIGNTTNPTSRIDTSKLALQPGQTEASIEAAPGGTSNFIKYYSGFIAGINGLVVDIANTVGVPTASDFEFRTWNGISGSPATSFVLTAATPTVTNLGLVGPSGSRRIKIEFVDNAIKNTWLQVTVLANPATTGLSAPNVFYFGSAAGDVGVGNGQSLTTGNFWQVTVTGTDGSAVLANQTAPGGASIGNNFDVGKNLGVSGTDRTQILSQAQGPVLRFFNAPAPPPSMMMSSGESSSSSLAPLISSPSVVAKRTRLIDLYFEELEEVPSE